MKIVAIVCLLSVTLYSCASTTSSTSHNPYEGAIVTGAALILVFWLFHKAHETQKVIMHSWVGSNISDLIRSWGPPQQVVSDGAGGKIYIWSSHVKIPLEEEKREGSAHRIGNSIYYEEKTSPATNIEYDKMRMFWVNPQGIIYHWKYKGL